MKKILSPSKFQRHIKKEILQFITYYFNSINPRSPTKNIQEAISEISEKSGGIIKARLRQKSRKITIEIVLPTEWTMTLDNVEGEENSDEIN